MSRSTKFHCDVCKNEIANKEGIALYFIGSKACEIDSDWNKCGSHVCVACTRTIRGGLSTNQKSDLDQAMVVKTQLLKLLSQPPTGSWEPIYEFVRDQTKASVG